MKFSFAVSAVAVTTSAVSMFACEARGSSSLFGVSRTTFGKQQNQNNHHNAIIESLANNPLLDIARGGETGTRAVGEEEAVQEKTLYLPGLLESKVTGKGTQSTASSDYTVSISPVKAKELGVGSGDIVAIIGRRRRVSYATVKVSKMSSGSVGVKYNLAMNLRIRDTDQVKIVPLGSAEGDDKDAYGTGDMALVTSTPAVAAGVTFSPVKDSLHSLELSEGGDELSEDEIMERFVTPYLNMEGGDVVLKKGHTLVLMDDNRVSLEFTVTHLDMEGDVEDEEAEVDEEGKFLPCSCLYFL